MADVNKLFHAGVVSLQDRITAAVCAIDPTLKVVEDLWTRTDTEGEPGGGGRTRVVSGGVVFEGGGINTSAVYGALDPAFAKQLGGQPTDRLFAAGISLILHPRNPRVPTTHANFRLVQVGERTWFGGGADLTPYHPHTEDFRHFHRAWRDATASLGTFESWKSACDRYFSNTHRGGEMRGVGGVFFDHWRSGDLEDDAGVVLGLGEQFLPSYLPIVERRRYEPWSDAEEEFMLYRRGRYVEFNLLHDRGTHFGLKTNGRTESILVSLPPRVQFGYQWTPAPDSPQSEMLDYYWPRDWA